MLSDVTTRTQSVPDMPKVLHFHNYHIIVIIKWLCFLLLILRQDLLNINVQLPGEDRLTNSLLDKTKSRYFGTFH
jgi:hypothetical protein